MILYATKQTVERYGIKMPEELQDPVAHSIAMDVYSSQKGNPLLEWGVKLFYVDRRKCIQICNFASKFTIVLVDIKKSELVLTAQSMALYLLDIYSDDSEMTALLKRFFKDYPFACFSRLTDKRIIATMNRFQSVYLLDGYRLYDFIENNVMLTKKMNKEINRDYMVTDKIDGKTQYFFPADRFAELLKEYYKK